MNFYENICTHAFNAFYGECLRTSPPQTYNEAKEDEEAKEKHHRRHKQEESANVAHFLLLRRRRLWRSFGNCATGKISSPLRLISPLFFGCFSRILLCCFLLSGGEDARDGENFFFFFYVVFFGKKGRQASEGRMERQRRLFNPPQRGQKNIFPSIKEFFLSPYSRRRKKYCGMGSRPDVFFKHEKQL